MREVCADASLILSLLLPGEESERTDAIWGEWVYQGVSVVGPPLLYAEVTSVIRNAVWKAKLSEEEGERAFKAFCALQVKKIDHPELHAQAWKKAKELGLPKAYDSFYLSLAELEDCELWTGDRRFYNQARQKYPCVRWIGEYVP
jgi:predicted nucleic acid-binding protein